MIPSKARKYIAYEEPNIVLLHGDCMEILPLLEETNIDLVLADPPYGLNLNCNAKRFTRKNSPWWNNVDTSKVKTHPQIIGDDKPFDPTPFLKYKSILWGGNHYASKLKDSGGWLIWDKRKGAEDLAEKGWPLGEAELAWTNILGSTRVFRNLWSGLLRSEEKGDFFHPTQKPINLMKWCMSFAPKAKIILDPYLGSGTTAVASKQLGRQCIGIEIEKNNINIAIDRLRQEILI
jgi:DNA modification methylase